MKNWFIGPMVLVWVRKWWIGLSRMTIRTMMIFNQNIWNNSSSNVELWMSRWSQEVQSLDEGTFTEDWGSKTTLNEHETNTNISHSNEKRIKIFSMEKWSIEMLSANVKRHFRNINKQENDSNIIENKLIRDDWELWDIWPTE
jgi:hypothetical protein